MPSYQAQLDAAARQKGFKNYDQYAAWQRNTQGVVMQGNPGAAPAAEPNNWLMRLLESIPGHPANTLGYVNRRMEQALGRKR